LQQLRENLGDLAERVAERAPKGAEKENIRE